VIDSSRVALATDGERISTIS